MKMVPFYGTVYKSSRYDLIIPLPACESGWNGKKDMRLFLRPGKLERTAPVFRIPGTVIAGTPWRLEKSCRLFEFTHSVSRRLRQGAR